MFTSILMSFCSSAHRSLVAMKRASCQKSHQDTQACVSEQGEGRGHGGAWVYGGGTPKAPRTLSGSVAFSRRVFRVATLILSSPALACFAVDVFFGGACLGMWSNMLEDDRGETRGEEALLAPLRDCSVPNIQRGGARRQHGTARHDSLYRSARMLVKGCAGGLCAALLLGGQCRAVPGNPFAKILCCVLLLAYRYSAASCRLRDQATRTKESPDQASRKMQALQRGGFVTPPLLLLFPSSSWLILIHRVQT